MVIYILTEIQMGANMTYMENSRGDDMIAPNTKALRMVRIRQGLSARGLALKAGLNPATIAGIEKTGHPVNPATAKAVCDALAVSFDDLFVVREGRHDG